ncbi:glycosyltransferase family 2 protein [Methylovorus sp. MP688]|uniref:glycosyltransferase family 2 protein n=1 Tax=Methylovorus sp. (strain MP688) TaxID=887061 RepID=UPI0001EC4325|nr:galactosyltransferase-related protein [Methylovorus sp. MP688]ADQ83297.1 glycosyl transferase family 2 [Methylovorus sp. MP688]
MKNTITVSVVSHGHGALLNECLRALTQCPDIAKVVLTLNIAEPLLEIPEALVDRIYKIENMNPKGFGENHNQAFRFCNTPLFCVLNPDITFNGDPFSHLKMAIAETDVGVIAPVVRAPDGAIEDNVRQFPTLSGLISKVIFGKSGAITVPADSTAISVDWVAGMFMLFRSEWFSMVGGFDTHFFLYYEDADICTRLWKSRAKIKAIQPMVHVTHAAQRASHVRLRFLTWHLQSMARYFMKHAARLPRRGE